MPTEPASARCSTHHVVANIDCLTTSCLPCCIKTALPVSLSRNMQMRVDHRNGTLHFGSQQLESDKVRSHLSLLAKRMAKAAAMTDLHCSAQ